MSDDQITQDNFRKLAQQAISKYEETNRIGDALFWREILLAYERELRSVMAKPAKGKAVAVRQ